MEGAGNPAETVTYFEGEYRRIFEGKTSECGELVVCL